MTTRLRCVIYTRVSTDEQAKDGRASLDIQEEECRAFAEAEGWDVVDAYREDYSGSSMDRPELSVLRDRLRADAYDVMICYTVDRWTRTQSDGNALLRELRHHEVGIHFVRGSIDLNEENGEMVLQFYFWQAERERKDILRRTMSGKVARLKDGKPWTATAAAFGYSREPKSYEFTTNEHALIIERLYREVDSGESLSRLAKTLNAEGVPSPGAGRQWKDGRTPRWSSAVLSQLLKNPAYKGWATAQRSQIVRRKGTARQVDKATDEWVVIDTTGAAIPPIVSSVLWDRVNAKLTANAGDKARNVERFHLMRGRVICGKCEQRMYPHTYGGRQPPTYRCSHMYRGRGSCPGVGSVREAFVDTETWAKVKGWLLHPQDHIDEINERESRGPDPRLNADRHAHVLVIKDLQTKLDRIMQRMGEEDDDILYAELRSQHRQYRDRKAAAEEQIADIDDRLAEQSRSCELTRELVAFLERTCDSRTEASLDALSVEQKRDMIEAIEWITIADSPTELRFEARFSPRTIQLLLEGSSTTTRHGKLLTTLRLPIPSATGESPRLSSTPA